MADASAFWLYEEGIGEDRALLMERGQPVEMRIERHGALRVGTVVEAKIARVLGRGRAVAVGDDRREYLAEKLPRTASEGSAHAFEVRRVALAERGRYKWPLIRPTDAVTGQGPSLEQRIAADGLPVQTLHPTGVDRLAEHGWHDLVEAARNGEWQFAGGILTISPTPAMTLIDVDGDGAPRTLAFNAAPEIAHVIRLFGLSGNIGVDFPTLEAKADRNAVAEAFDVAMVLPCERTGVNGFGFMQVVTRRTHLSVIEYLSQSPVEHAGLSLLRQAERTTGTGALTLRCHPQVAMWLEGRSELIAMLGRKVGRPVSIVRDPNANAPHKFDCVNEGENLG